MDVLRRAQNVLMTPRTEWPVIAAESADVGSLYVPYIASLAAVPAVAAFLGLMVFGRFVFVRPGIAAYLTVAGYVVSLISPLVGAAVLQRLAPRFRSTGTLVDALKLVAYSSTPIWVAGAINLVPVFSPLVALGVIYGIYLFYLGLPVIMKTPLEQVVPFMVVTAITILVINIVLNFLILRVSGPYPGI
jgi:hypothetical protein